MTKKDVVG